MTRPEEIAAALERWEKMDEGCDLDDIWGAGDELARLLRAADPPAVAERVTEPVTDAEQIRRDRGRTFISEPATPAVGEDEALLDEAERFCHVAAANGGSGVQELIDALAARLRYVEAELARLREGLKVQDGDVDEERLALWGPDKISRWIGSMAREIQRHRALVAK